MTLINVYIIRSCYIFIPPFSASQVQLVSFSGNTGTSGRLEILINNTWGTICVDSFDILDANVACRELGFDAGIAFIRASQLRYTSR